MALKRINKELTDLGRYVSAFETHFHQLGVVSPVSGNVLSADR